MVDELFAELNSRMQKAVDGLAEEFLTRMQARADTAKARARRLATLRDQIYGLAGGLGGSGVRQGSLYPPTETHRMRKAYLEARLGREREGLKELEAWERQ